MADNDTKQGIRLLDFWAEWCGPCKIMEPVLDELETDYKNRVIIDKINVDEDENQELVNSFQIMSVPTYILMKDGEVVDHFVGVQSKNMMTQKIDAVLAGA